MQSIKHNRVLIGLGSNLGDPGLNLKQAISLVKERLATELVVSPLYRSEPVGWKEQPWFFNQAVYFYDNLQLGPLAILRILKVIESEMGRLPTVRFGPRIIDLDLLFYENWVFEGSNLVIPHPRFDQRSFVLLPLLDLEPGIVDPRSGMALQDIWERNCKKLAGCFKVDSGA